MRSAMNANGQPQPPADPRPSRHRLLFGTALGAALLAAALFALTSLRHSPPEPPTPTASAPEPKAAPAPKPVPAPSVPATPKPGAPVAAEIGPRTARQLMDELLQLSAISGPLTREQAEKIRQNLAELVKQGAAAVPAIREFLEKNREFYYQGGEGAEVLGYPSLRAGLIDALGQIAGPEAQGALLQAVKTSATPAELLALANHLEKQAPGQFRDEILSAARETLAMAATNQLQLGTNVELGPAFRILRNYGDANTTADVAKNDPGSFVDAVALANLPDGQGLPSLLQMAENSGGTSQRMATEMIAQLAGQNPDALAGLVGLAQKGQVPNNLWVSLAPILGGDQYQLSGPNASGGQNYEIHNIATTPDEINQRIAILEALLSIVGDDSSAARALRQQRDLLAAKLSQ